MDASELVSLLPYFCDWYKKTFQEIASGEPVLREGQTLSKRGEQEVIRLINQMIQNVRSEWSPFQNNRIFFKIFFQMVSGGGSTLRRLRSSQGG